MAVGIRLKAVGIDRQMYILHCPVYPVVIWSHMLGGVHCG